MTEQDNTPKTQENPIPEQPETPEAVTGEIVHDDEDVAIEAEAAAGEALKETLEDMEEAAESAAEAVIDAETAAEEEMEASGELSPEMAALIEELKEARQAADEARDHALRAQAELQNFRRRKEREVAERIALANEKLILELLPVLDDFERAFEAIPEEDREAHAAWIEGFELIYRKLQKILENQGLEAIDASGEFNPEVHEAVTMAPSDQVESGHIVQEFRKGYKLKDKVIRASLVSVAE